jgi:hypothetical protein
MEQKNKCGICGRKGQRLCPALNGMICSSCCGSKRGNDLECPSHCLYFPFGTEAYDLYLKIDATWAPKVAHYVIEAVGKKEFERTLRQMGGGTVRDIDPLEYSFIAAVYYLLGFQKDRNGKTVAQRWEEEGWYGLNNDERYMMKFRKNSFPTIIEIQKILDEQSLRCIDVFQPAREPFVIFDRSLARTSVRFSRFLGWITHYPYFSRPDGGGLIIPTTIYRRYCDELYRRVGAVRDENTGEMRSYLAGYFGECCDLITEMSHDYNQRMIESLDAYHCRAFYDLKGDPSEVERIIERKPEFMLDERGPAPNGLGNIVSYDWVRRGESKKIEESMPAMFRYEDESRGVGNLGSLKLSSGKSEDPFLEIEIFGRKKYEFAKEMVQRYFGHLVSFSREEIEDLRERIGEEREDPEMSRRGRGRVEEEGDIPSEVEQALLEQAYREHYKKFLDDEIPALDGLTPREAARDFHKRPRLLDLMKDHVHSISSLNRENEFEVSIDWVLEELGLNELL